MVIFFVIQVKLSSIFECNILGDPLTFHAKFIVYILDWEETIRPITLVSIGRLANNVKKDVLLVSVNVDNKIHYITVKWKAELR